NYNKFNKLFNHYNKITIALFVSFSLLISITGFIFLLCYMSKSSEYQKSKYINESLMEKFNNETELMTLIVLGKYQTQPPTILNRLNDQLILKICRKIYWIKNYKEEEENINPIEIPITHGNSIYHYSLDDYLNTLIQII